MTTDALAVVLLTYGRLAYAKKTLESVTRNLVLPQGVELHVHIASDGDAPDYINEVASVSHVPVLTASNSQRRGYGANYNYAMETVWAVAGVKYVLPLEDDWELVRPFDVSDILDCLKYGVFGCVRMGYLGYTQPLKCEFVAFGGKHWLRLNPDSEEPHVFAGHPRIETVAWEKQLGHWQEGLQPGETEWEVSHRPESRVGVGWPISLIPPEGNVWAHIGTERSW